MKSLRRALHEYLHARRALGFKLPHYDKPLGDFVDYLARSRSAYLTSPQAIAWATQPRDVHPAWWAHRLSMVRGFAKHLQASDPRHEVPPFEALPFHRPRSTPYIYEPAEIAALLTATTTLRSPLTVATYRTLLGLIAVTGLRGGEAVALDDGDVERRHGLLVIRKTKFGKTREVPLHATTLRALVRYAHERDRLAPRRRTRSFFVSLAGTRLIYSCVHRTFLHLVGAAGLADRRPRRPRIHDLRHAFAVRTVLGWYRGGVDVEAKLPMLSTYLGHIRPSSTYWYLSAVPELLEAATIRLERAWKVRP
jgi:integrase